MLDEQHFYEVALRTAADEEEATEVAAADYAHYRWRLARAGKTCPSCGKHLPWGAFSPDASRNDGVFRICKACRRASRKR